ncbi:hypothetical protein [Bosea sp. PAMC 26642]|uniref:hypothetical protein n=1 Tax=Bosea sp. (strain PAMC 26642) TaxID=1792307 RepID=UPI0007702036|nr:hypothetical protein [Bosea sp. PAMC 26642]AMJ62282.1 hypothetical protein AXW83_20035 [Bosea sp. PAMC 26642]
MDAFTMVVLACVSGEMKCTSARISDSTFTTADACEARVDEIVGSMTSQFAKRPEFKGRQVTYDISCMNKQQLWATLGIAESQT